MSCARSCGKFRHSAKIGNTKLGADCVFSYGLRNCKAWIIPNLKMWYVPDIETWPVPTIAATGPSYSMLDCNRIE